MSSHTILVVNPGSTSTKLALFADEQAVAGESIRHEAATIQDCATLWDKFDLRRDAVRAWVAKKARAVDAIAALGGLLRPLCGGTYAVNDRMLADARANLQGEHASNLGCALAHELGAEYGCPAFVVDPVSVDEFEPLARYSGHPLIQRRTLSHALNLHAAARRAASEIGVPLAESRLIVAHLGGGISIAPVRGGRIIDVNDASSDGPFSAERTGGLPMQRVIDLCFAGDRTARDMRALVMGRGGLVAYLGTNSALDVERRIYGGDPEAREVFEAMAYQIAKEIGAMATVLAGRIDGIVLAGGLASSPMLTDWIRERVEFLAPIFIYPGEDEMASLAAGALCVLRGQAQPLEY